MSFPITLVATGNSTVAPIQTNLDPMLSNWADIFTIVAVLVAIFFSILSATIAYLRHKDLQEQQERLHEQQVKLQEQQERSIKGQETQGKFQKLLEVYRMINNFDEREARKNIYKAYRIYDLPYIEDMSYERIVYSSLNINKGTEYDDIFRDPEVLFKMGISQDKILQDVERVRATLDHIGALFKYDLVPKEGLLDAMWGTVRVCWICLEHNIMIERDKRKTHYYMDHFKHLFDEIEQFIDDKK